MTNELADGKPQDDSHSRRTLLRGALALGCGWLLALGGCDSKKGAAPSTAAPSAPAGPPKASQASVQYQTRPKGDQKCGNCQNLIPESNTCKLVEGKISPEGWCVLWAKKA